MLGSHEPDFETVDIVMEIIAVLNSNESFTYFSFLNWGRGIERMWEIRPVAENKTQESISEDEYSKLQSLKKRNGISLKFYLFSTSFCSSLEAPPPFSQNTHSCLSF